MSAAQLDIQQPDEAAFDDVHAAAAPFALKQQAAERIAAHRARRQKASPAPAVPIAIAAPARARAARIAATVAERYAHSQSYRSFIAAEAEKAIHQAEAAADVAVLNAQAVAEAQYSLLAELDQLAAAPAAISQPVDRSRPLIPAPIPALSPALNPTSPQTRNVSHHTQPARSVPGAGVTIRLLEDLTDHGNDLTASFTNSQLFPSPDPLGYEGMALDDEIAFRQSPVFEPSTPPIEIAANLIEFPRQLVAARRARPRLAEGPLREDGETENSAAQLRIFEVEAAQISTAPALASSATEWSSILLDAYPVSIADEALYAPEYTPHYAPYDAEHTLKAQLDPGLASKSAPVNLRLMAAAVDLCLILAAGLAFTATAALTIGQLLTGPSQSVPMQPGLFNLQTIAFAASGILILLAALYQILFFTFSDATPGMRYARIALCTFNDENPSRSAMRRRAFALFLSASPLGLGILWVWLDADHLGWHDRISRIYQRSY